MENEAKIGMNRTGMQMSPYDGPDQVEYASTRPADPPSNDGQAATMRAQYMRSSERVGSVPLPVSAKGLAGTTIDKITGKSPEALIDKLGQRLAFERGGVRLYQAMIGKTQAVQPPRAKPLLADLRHICGEELAHAQMLTNVIRDMGGDPTAQTPCADISGVAALGLVQVVTDPRTTIAQSLEALLTAELTDNACWELLIELADQAGHEQVQGPFRKALASEQEHKKMITRWLRHCTLPKP